MVLKIREAQEKIESSYKKLCQEEKIKDAN